MTSNITHIYTNGCSWTRQHGISSDPNFPTCDEKDKFAKAQDFSWPNLVAAHFGADLRNDAIGGGSNSRIVRTTCDFIRRVPHEKYQDLLVIIGWTAPERDEIYIEYNDHKEWHLFNPSSPFSSQFSNQHFPYPPHVMQSLEEYHGTYTRLIQNDRADLVRFFNNVFLLTNLLENLGIKHLFFSSIGFPQMRHGNSVLGLFEDEFRLLKHPRYMGMDQQRTMQGFCHDLAVPVSPCLHPMMLGHRLWSEHIIKCIGDAI